MSRNTNGKSLAPVNRFDYGAIDIKKAEKVQTITKAIKEKIHRSLVGLVEAGQGLLTVKDILPHGHFGLWLEMEFGWTDRTARRLMDVAEQFGPKTDIMSDLMIVPTAFYLLAAPSTPFEARQKALERAQSGEKITPAIAKEIIWTFRKMAIGKRQPFQEEGLSKRLAKALERLLDRIEPKDVPAFARQLRQFANSLEKGMRR